MRCQFYTLLCLLLPLSVAAALAETDAKPDSTQLEFFEKQIRPILVEHCQKCHGPEKQKGGLRVDSRAALLGAKTCDARHPSDSRFAARMAMSCGCRRPASCRIRKSR